MRGDEEVVGVKRPLKYVLVQMKMSEIVTSVVIMSGGGVMSEVKVMSEVVTSVQVHALAYLLYFHTTVMCRLN